MNELQTIEYKNERVLTTKQLAESYEVEEIKLVKNFNNNKERYIEGKHYNLLKGNELKLFKGDIQNLDIASNVNILYLWTERGALLHAKSLNTDKAWQVYDVLVETYFSVKETHKPLTLKESLQIALELLEKNEQLEFENTAQKQIISEYKPKIDYVDTILKSKALVTVTSIAKDYGMSAQELNNLLHDQKIQYSIGKGKNKQWFLYKEYQDQGYTQSETVEITLADGRPSLKLNTKWTQKGRLFIHGLLTNLGIKANVEKLNEN